MQDQLYEQIMAEHPDYFRRFDASKRYEQILFRAGKGLQSRELNDVQGQVSHQIKSVADALLKDGDIVAGGGVKIEGGVAKVAAASVYLSGAVRPVAEASISFDPQKDSIIGVFLDTTVVTELEDGTLRDPAGKNSPMVHTNYDEPGAARLKVVGRWDVLEGEQSANSEFYPVYQINQGVLMVKEAPPHQDAITRALARYDRESNGGNYVVEGLGLHYIKTENERQHFSLQSGKAHIAGYELSYAMALPVTFAADPDVVTIKAERAQLAEGEDATAWIKVDFPPLKSVERVSIEVRTTDTITRTAAQLKDSFPNTSVSYIEKVVFNETVYVEGEDYKHEDNHIVWQLDATKARPPAGSSYDVTYVYGKVVSAQHTQTHYKIDDSFLNDGDSILTNEIEADYQRLSPRVDLFVLDKQGVVQRIKGVSALEYPEPPHAPEQHLPLAYVYQQWGDQPPKVESISINALSMLDLHNMQRQIYDLYQLLAIERLKNDANSQESSSKYGVFVDPFLDDDLRDQGLDQNAAIVDGELSLPVDAKVISLNSEQSELLPFELEDVLVQPKRTGSMKVNPYQAFEPIPAQVTLTPSVDHWTVTRQRWSSPITRRFTRGNGPVRSTTQTQRVSTQTQQAEFLRAKRVNFSIKGFADAEQLTKVIFDGIELTPEVTSE